MIHEILALYGLNESEYKVTNFGSGLINGTWLVSNGKKYILQKVNKAVFNNPQLIDANIHSIKNCLQKNKSNYNLIIPLPALNGDSLAVYKDEFYRLFPYINSKTFLTATDTGVACEASKQFGKFANNLAGFKADELHETIPHFHDLKLRYEQFLQSIKYGNKERINQSKNIIQSMHQHKNIVDAYDGILQNSSFKKRVTHHDTKISNVLFDENNKGIAVIDLDTVMPGYFISDVGDMLRTYLSPASEEEINFNLVEARDEYFKAIAEGYLSEMKDELSFEEINAFVYAGKFMIYMQALRFIADYLNNDIYYGAKYELHNFNRAKNQLYLLECLIEKEDNYNLIVRKLIN